MEIVLIAASTYAKEYNTFMFKYAFISLCILLILYLNEYNKLSADS